MGLLRSDKPKKPNNYLDLWSNGTALWEVWSDQGPGTVAEPIIYADRNYGRAFFLNDSSAAKVAKRLATENPDRRYAIKEASAGVTSGIIASREPSA